MHSKDFQELLLLVERCIYHTECKTGQGEESKIGYVISGVHVNLPVNGNMDHLINLERRMVCESARDARMEEEASAKILAHQLAYLIEHEDTFENPVFQENEFGRPVQIGRAVIMLDRQRIKFPTMCETTTNVYLNCCKETA
jgi:hypothetical protein